MRRTIRFLSVGFAAIVATAMALPAQAGLLGATVYVAAFYPNTASLYNYPGNRVVGAAIEYPANSYPLYNGAWQVDITDSQVLITDFSGGGLPVGTAAFNGFILTVLSGPALLSASIDAGSTIIPVSVAIVGGDLQMNLSGVSETVGGTAIINFTTADATIPEPASLVLLGAGLLGLASARRR